MDIVQPTSLKLGHISWTLNISSTRNGPVNQYVTKIQLLIYNQHQMWSCCKNENCVSIGSTGSINRSNSKSNRSIQYYTLYYDLTRVITLTYKAPNKSTDLLLLKSNKYTDMWQSDRCQISSEIQGGQIWILVWFVNGLKNKLCEKNFREKNSGRDTKNSKTF